MFKIFKLLIYCFVYCFIGGLQAAPSLAKLNLSSDAIDLIANDALAMFNVPGLAVGLVIDDHILITRGYGSRNINEDLPVTERTLFSIGSCSKAFTALMLGQLVDEGKVALDDPVKKYIPEFSLLDQETAKRLTIRDLLAHRTGIARHDAIWVYSEISRPGVIALLPHLEQVCGLGKEFQYNSFMYTIAGIVIERVAGRSWEQELSDRLLKPLGMTDTNASLEDLQKSADHSLPHAEIERVVTVIPFRNILALNPAGGVNSTIKDMAKWVRLQLSDGKTIIKSRTLKELHTMQIPIFATSYDISPLGYSLGWFIGEFRGHDLIGHGGNIDGFSSEVCFLPKERIGLVILTNSTSDGQYAISYIRNQIFSKILAIQEIEWLSQLQGERDKAKLGLYKELKAFNEVSQTNQSVHSLYDYVGSYEDPAYGIIELRIEDNCLVALYGKLSIPLYYKSENVFTGQLRDLLAYGVNPVIDIVFKRDSSGNISQMHVPFESFRGAEPIKFIRK